MSSYSNIYGTKLFKQGKQKKNCRPLKSTPQSILSGNLIKKYLAKKKKKNQASKLDLAMETELKQFSSLAYVFLFIFHSLELELQTAGVKTNIYII